MVLEYGECSITTGIHVVCYVFWVSFFKNKFEDRHLCEYLMPALSDKSPISSENRKLEEKHRKYLMVHIKSLQKLTCWKYSFEA